MNELIAAQALSSFQKSAFANTGGIVNVCSLEFSLWLFSFKLGSKKNKV
jgi:hypothetical protein